MTDLHTEEPKVRHKTVLRVPLFEVDLGQAVYHGNYYHLFELAREQFLRDLGYSYRCFMDQRLHLAVVEAACAYRRSLRYDELIEIHTGIAWVRTRSLAFSQLIFLTENTSELVLCTKASLSMVCVRFTGQPSKLPVEFTQLLRDWMEKPTDGKV